MNQDTQPGDLRVSRVIDFKIPLSGILGAAFTVAAVFGGMYFKLGQLSEDMAELKITVKAGNGQAATLQGELAILKFRIENLEADKRAIGINGGTR
jgi:hypothetical protein